MGRKDQFTRNLNPAKAKIEWKGADDRGVFSFYTKDTGEVELKKLKFAVLAERHAVGGFSKRHKTGTFSNEIDDIGEEILIVRKSVGGEKQELCRGIYKEMGEKLAYHQVSYQKIVYAMILDCDQIKRGTIVKLSLSGSSASAWFDLSTNDKLKAIVWAGYTDETNGTNDYRKPVFETADMTKAEDDAAEERYEKVEAYIGSKATVAARNPAEEHAQPDPDELPQMPEEDSPAEDVDAPMEDNDDIPF